MKSLYISALVILAACNSAGDSAGTDSTATPVTDTPGDTRGLKGAGVDNNGGTPGPGTLTDTMNGQIDTADHTSKRGKDSAK